MKKAYKMAFLLAGAFFVSVGVLGVAYRDVCTIERRLPVPITITENLVGKINEYRKTDVLGFSCQNDVIVTPRNDTMEFDCWKNKTYNPTDECRCEINVISYPKQKLWVC